jgi:hypothetical protein
MLDLCDEGRFDTNRRTQCSTKDSTLQHRQLKLAVCTIVDCRILGKEHQQVSCR